MARAKPATRRARDVKPLIEAMGPPVARARWSPEFAVQSIEIFPVALGEDGGAIWFKPVHADSLRVAMRRGVAAAELVLEVIGWYPLEPIVVHSTSWREEDGRVVLTYVTVVRRPESLPPGSLDAAPVRRHALARGETLAAPARVEVAAVLEHAFRHLAWLLQDDPAIGRALPDWRGILAEYVPEPFRALPA